MKKSFMVVVMGSLLVLSSVYAAPAKLRVVGSWSSLSLYKEYEKPFWKKDFIKEFPSTKVRLSSLGQIKLRGASVYRELAKGVFDVVSTVGGYVVSDSQTLAGLDFPALTDDIKTAKKVVNSYKKTLDEALKNDFNAKLLSVVPYPAQVLFCKDRISSLADLKGKKVRASGGTDEISGYILGICSSWSLAYVLFQKMHIRIDILYVRVSKKFQHIFDIVAMIFTLMFISLLVYSTFSVFYTSLIKKSTANTPLGTALWIPQSIWFFGFVFFMIVVLVLLYHAISSLITGKNNQFSNIEKDEVCI